MVVRKAAAIEDNVTRASIARMLHGVWLGSEVRRMMAGYDASAEALQVMREPLNSLTLIAYCLNA